jgi:RNA polymerase sigma-70 factor, ECF subfamily
VLERIYREHFHFVWRSLRRLGVPEADLPDAVHDVFLVVEKKIASFEGRSAVTTWLYAICMRVASGQRRASRRTREVLEADAHGVASENTAAASEQRQGLELLDDLLDDLPLDQRAVFTCYELDGMSGEQIAELLEIPLGTVWSRLRLARERFRRAASRLRARQDFRPRGSGVRAL